MVMRRGDVLVPLDRHPLVVFLLALCVLSGVTNLLVVDPRAPHVPAWSRVLWYGLLIFGGLTALVGAWWRDAITGVLIVRAAMWPVGAGAYAWAVVVGHTGRPLDVVGAVIVVAFGLCAHWRAWQISAHVRLARAAR